MALWTPGVDVQRMLFAAMRQWSPVLSFGKTVLVSSYDDVTDVLERPEDFSVVPLYDQKMRETSGAFFLGMDDTLTYRREANILRRAVRKGDGDSIRAIVAQTAREAIDGARPRGRIDAVSELTRLVPTVLLERYFGIDGADRATLQRWMRVIFHHLFLNLEDDQEVRQIAIAAAAELRAHLEALVARRKQAIAGGDTRDDFLSRLVRMQKDDETRLDDDAIQRNVAGVIIGSVDTVSKAAIFAIDTLLGRPEELRAASEAACRGDIEAVAGFASEALRFNPHNPLLVRQALRATTVGAAGGNPIPIQAGSRVYALTLSAMFDERRLPDPDRFVPTRSNLFHLQFGHGMHECFGRVIVGVELPEVVAALLRLDGLRRVRGSEGQIKYDGPFPDGLALTFDATSSSQVTQ